MAGIQMSADAQRKKAAPETFANERLDKQMSELMASRVSPAQIISDELAIAKLDEFNELTATENLMFPADELYNSNWDTIHVNPFVNTKIDFPDSYNINCSSFSMPVDYEQIKINSKYGPRRRRMHRGIDLALQVGDTIRAAFGGKVRLKSFERRGYGYYLVLRHPNGLETVYGHLSKFLVGENQIVRSGDPIALGGNTGRSTGPHLHFETRFLGKDIDPAEIIDFENKIPHKDEYVFYNIKINGKKSNIYATSADAVVVHRVKQGETLSLIARKYGTTVAELCRLNGILQTSKLSIGQSIRYRAKQVTVETSSDAIQSRPANTEKTQTPAANASSNAGGRKIEIPIQTSSPEETADGTVYHTIQSGDTLFSLSKKYNVSIEKLCEMNDIRQNMILKIGQKIRCS
ncbi:MAG: peptidoglycan DD-metalloendopeptidase family protein [Tannerella sp.]|jgi:murein DD-endopeptidase MepM/ murein hydrolase activator NlpD|nr:peptidoglycan DD-metalloendopeptidase family protein [Tannerella sp.]